MNFGFNSNVRVGDAMYHVQTEDRGPAHPFLDTVVYLSGRVVSRRSTNYREFSSDQEGSDLVQKLREGLAQQHREVIAELQAGTLTMQAKEIASSDTDVAEAAIIVAESKEDELDLLLANPKTWYSAGDAIFEIRLCEKRSRHAVEGADVQACLEIEKRRIPCAEVHTDAEGWATLKFALPADIRDGSLLVVRATDAGRYAQLRFRLKSKPVEKAPAPVS